MQDERDSPACRRKSFVLNFILPIVHRVKTHRSTLNSYMQNPPLLMMIARCRRSRYDGTRMSNMRTTSKLFLLNQQSFLSSGAAIENLPSPQSSKTNKRYAPIYVSFKSAAPAKSSIVLTSWWISLPTSLLCPTLHRASTRSQRQDSMSGKRRHRWHS